LHVVEVNSRTLGLVIVHCHRQRQTSPPAAVCFALIEDIVFVGVHNSDLGVRAGGNFRPILVQGVGQVVRLEPLNFLVRVPVLFAVGPLVLGAEIFLHDLEKRVLQVLKEFLAVAVRGHKSVRLPNVFPLVILNRVENLGIGEA
jgi:hypothetical protein